MVARRYGNPATPGIALNEYTRREEITWTLVTVLLLVPAMAVAIVLLVMAKGPMVTDPDLVIREEQAQKNQAAFESCPAEMAKLQREFPIFSGSADNAKKQAEEEAKKKKVRRRYGRKKEPVKPVTYEVPWKAPAKTVLKSAHALKAENCEVTALAATGANDDAKPAWIAVTRASELADPGADQEAQQKVAKKLLELFKKAPLNALTAHGKLATEQLAAKLAAATKSREVERIRAPLPQGLLPRGAAIGIGVGVALAALIISYISVRSASMRRAKTLVALRRFANTPEAGLQAAAIVRLGAHHNGGEPGMVLGAAMGGLLAALIAPTTDPNSFMPDMFVAGAMGGLLIGLTSQWVTRTLAGMSRWRGRAQELGDIEKPTIPVQLIMRGVTLGLEKQFVRYFEALSIADAAMVVQKLAAQAEEQILAAADAANAPENAAYQQADQWRQPAGPQGGGFPGQM